MDPDSPSQPLAPGDELVSLGQNTADGSETVNPVGPESEQESGAGRPGTPSSTTTTNASDSAEKDKVDVLLKAVGDAPIMKKKRWAVEPHKKVAWVADFVRRYIKCEPNESLFLYVNQCFAPCLDQDIGSLYECFGADGKLVLHYCKHQAWG